MGVKKQLVAVADKVFRFNADSLLQTSNDIVALLKTRPDRNRADIPNFKAMKCKLSYHVLANAGVAKPELGTTTQPGVAFNDNALAMNDTRAIAEKPQPKQMPTKTPGQRPSWQHDTRACRPNSRNPSSPVPRQHKP